MSESKALSRRDRERISSYIDGELTAREAASLEARLESDPALQRALDEMRWTVGQLRELPEVRSRRNFTLTPEMAGVRERGPAYPLLRLATALAMIAFFVTVGLDVLLPAPMGALGLQAGSEPALVESVQEMQAPDETERAEPEAEAPMAMEAPEEPAAQPEQMDEAAPAEEMGTPAPSEMIPEQGDLLAATPRMAGDEESRAGAFTATPEGAGGAGEEPGNIGSQEIVGTPTATAELLETTATPEAPPGDGMAPGGPWPPLVRFVEIGLGLLAVILLGLTLRARRSAP